MLRFESVPQGGGEWEPLEFQPFSKGCAPLADACSSFLHCVILWMLFQTSPSTPPVRKYTVFSGVMVAATGMGAV